MEYRELQPSIDLNDPEGGFQFASEGEGVRLWFTDWRNKVVTRDLWDYAYRMAVAEGGANT